MKCLKVAVNKCCTRERERETRSDEDRQIRRKGEKETERERNSGKVKMRCRQLASFFMGGIKVFMPLKLAKKTLEPKAC